MPRRNPQRQGLRNVTPQQIVTPQQPRMGAPMGTGSNLNMLAGALGKFGSDLERKMKEQEAKAKQAEVSIDEQEKLAAQREFLAAKRANTLDELRKATISGALPEGASPAYNDYRKTLIAMDAVQNVYGKGLRDNLDTLANPDAPQEAKSQLMQELWQKAGIDQMGLDAFGMDKVNQAAMKIHTAIDEAGNKRFIELNKQKMDDSLGKVALNSVSAFQEPEELGSSYLNAIKMARDASVLDPVKRVSQQYFQAISNMAEEDPDRAQAALEALENTKFEDGAKPLGNIELQTMTVQLADKIERAQLEEERVADRRLAKMGMESARAIEAGLEGQAADNPQEIRKAYDAFLNANPDLPTEVKERLRDQRNNRMNKAMAEQTMDLNLKRQYIKETQVATDIYTKLAFDARDSIELQQHIEEVNSLANLDERDKAKIIANMSMINKARPIASEQFTDNLGEKEMAALGIDETGIKTLVDTYSMPQAVVEEDVGLITEQMRQTYENEFTKELTRLADERGLTMEQAKAMNLPTEQVDPVTKERIFDTQSTLVGQAAKVARARAGGAAVAAMKARRKEYSQQHALRTKSLDSISKALTTDLAASIKGYANSETLDPVTRGRAREAIVTTRVNLARLAVEATTEQQKFQQVAGVAELPQSPALNSYYQMQNALGYSLKEIMSGKSFAGVELDAARIEPATTRIVWNKKELEVLKRMPENTLNELASLFNVSDGQTLIELQTKLL